MRNRSFGGIIRGSGVQMKAKETPIRRQTIGKNGLESLRPRSNAKDSIVERAVKYSWPPKRSGLLSTPLLPSCHRVTSSSPSHSAQIIYNFPSRQLPTKLVYYRHGTVITKKRNTCAFSQSMNPTHSSLTPQIKI